MPAFCSCATTLANTGAPSSQKIIAVGVKLIAVNLFADDGTQNSIANTDTIDAAYLTAKINNDDPTKRWYPLPNFVNVDENREDPNYEEYTDGSRGITRLGRRTWSGKLLSHYSRYLAKLETFFCQSFGVYVIDDCGNLTGRISADGTALYPITVNEASWAPILAKETFDQKGGIMLSFDFAQTMKDKDLRVIEASEMTATMLDAKGLRDVDAVSSAPSTTGNTMTLTLPFDAFLGSSPHPAATGWVTADFDDIYNTTTASAVTLTSATEGADGVYTLVWPAQTASDVLRLRSNKDGFWYEILVTV